MSNLIELLLHWQLLAKLHLTGTSQEVSEFKNLIHMLESTQTGQQILQAIRTGKNLSKISFVTGFEDDPEVKGRFYRNTKEIAIVKIDTNIPEMTPKTRLQSEIMMASSLAHEMQHSIDCVKNDQLEKLASNINESVLATALSEMKAYLFQEQTNKELRVQYNLVPKVYIYHHPQDPDNVYRQASGPKDPLYVQYGGKELHPQAAPITPKNRKETMTKALSGKIPLIKRYMDKKRQWATNKKGFPKSTPAFQTCVENYLKDMQIDMSFEEAMRYVRRALNFDPKMPHPGLDR